jgi:iron only hydrogenase large subunit-like protein
VPCRRLLAEASLSEERFLELGLACFGGCAVGGGKAPQQPQQRQRAEAAAELVAA